MSYQLIDSGNGLKLEHFGKVRLIRPCAQAVWKPQKLTTIWQEADAIFSREQGNQWHIHAHLPKEWVIEVGQILFKLSTTDFGHLGIFPEQRPLWQKMHALIKKQQRNIEVLNLFAYSGGSTLACAQAGAKVCHLDASKGMVSWAKENALLNGLQNAPIRWIVDDVKKFLNRELKRGHRYDAIILDPPTFGRGAAAEVFKIDQDIPLILEQCRQLLSPNPLFLLFTCHTPGYTPLAIEQLVRQVFGKTAAEIEAGEMVLSGERELFSIPSGAYVFYPFS